MKRLLSSTTALSLAVFNVQPWPLMAQTLTADGYVVAADGSVLCDPTTGVACNPDEYIDAAMAIEAAMAAQAELDAAMAAEAAAQAEAEAAAQAEAEAAAQAEAEATAQAEAEAAAQAELDAAMAAEAEAAAQAEAEAAAQAEAQAAAQAEAEAAAQAEAQAAAQAEAEAAAQAELDAAMAAEAEAAAQAEAEAAAQAEADAAAQAEADAAAQVEAEAAAQAEAEAAAAQVEADAAAQAGADAAQAEADAAAQAEADAAAQAEADAAAQAEADAAAQAEADAAAQAEADAAAQAEADAAAQAEAEANAALSEADLAAKAEADAAAAAQAEVDAATQAEADAAALAAAEAELKVEDDGTLVDPSAGLRSAEPAPAEDVAPVDAPVVSDTEVESLTDLMTTTGALDPTALEAATALAESPQPQGEPLSIENIAPAVGAIGTVTEVLTEDTTRTSSQEFAAAPTAAADGKKSRLSDLEKVGLLALGALVVGTIINDIDNKRDRRVVSNTGDRVVVLNPDGTYQVYKDDDAVIRQPGSTVRTETFRDGSTRTIVERRDGTQIVTIRDASGRVLRRAQYDELGRELVLIDDLEPEEVVIIEDLPKPRKTKVVISTQDEDADLKAALAAKDIEKIGRKFSLRQIREIAEVRALAATIDVDAITFDSGSSAIKASEAEDLADLGSLMQEMIDANPAEMFLIEGHTDAVGAAAMNLALSDRRAESVALALAEYFEIPPENMVIQGYGESELRIDTAGDEKRNRRVAVRIISPLLKTSN